MSQSETPDSLSQGLVYCFVAIVLAVSLVGFLRGVNHADPQGHGLAVVPATSSSPQGDIPEARSYSEMREHPPGPGNTWDETVKTATKKAPKPLSASDLKKALAKRKKARAYDGAPPTIPHQVRQNSAAECMACHGQDLRLGQLSAQAVPHDSFSSCTQCHVTQDGPLPSTKGLARDPRAVNNSFQGTQAPVRGPRAWSIAPPQIPHATFMRENCMACHGPGGPSAMRSSHTSRKSCTQCHTAPAALNQQPALEGWLESQRR